MMGTSKPIKEGDPYVIGGSFEETKKTFKRLSTEFDVYIDTILKPRISRDIWWFAKHKPKTAMENLQKAMFNKK